MKFLKTYAAATLALIGMAGMVSCSNDEPLLGNQEGGAVEASSYIRVNIANLPDVGGVRANDPVYDAGTESERAISSIAYYFFYEDGTPFKMENNNINGGFTASNKVKPLMDLSSTTGVLGSTLVLGKAVNEGWKGTVPSKMVAVANIAPVAQSDAAYDKLANKTIDELGNELITAKASTPASGQFVMSTAVYVDGSKLIRWSDITLDNIKTTPDAAIESPVTIYMERLAAKVQVGLTPQAVQNSNRFLVATRPVVGVDGTQAQKDFYAEILGWDLNGTVTKGNLLKNLDITSPEPFPNWNLPLAHRSFWALTPALGLSNDNTKNQLNTAFTWENLKNAFNKADYCYENTLQPVVDRTQDASSLATKVLLKARIVDETGVKQDLISWAGTLYFVDDFKMMVAKFMDSENPNPEHVTFDRRTTGKVHVVSTYYDGELVPEFDNIREWKDGICYYIVNIRHAVDSKGQNVYGIVRNHSYRVTINSIKGLGTPGGGGSHDKPENPDPELESFVAATVELLPWHVVDFNVDVES